MNLSVTGVSDWLFWLELLVAKCLYTHTHTQVIGATVTWNGRSQCGCRTMFIYKSPCPSCGTCGTVLPHPLSCPRSYLVSHPPLMSPPLLWPSLVHCLPSVRRSCPGRQWGPLSADYGPGCRSQAAHKGSSLWADDGTLPTKQHRENRLGLSASVKGGGKTLSQTGWVCGVIVLATGTDQWQEQKLNIQFIIILLLNYECIVM